LSERCKLNSLPKLPLEEVEEMKRKERLAGEVQVLQTQMVLIYTLCTVAWLAIVFVFSFYPHLQIFKTSFVGLAVLFLFVILAVVMWIFMILHRLETLQQWLADHEANQLAGSIFNIMEGDQDPESFSSYAHFEDPSPPQDGLDPQAPSQNPQASPQNPQGHRVNTFLRTWCPIPRVGPKRTDESANPRASSRRNSTTRRSGYQDKSLTEENKQLIIS